MTAVEELAERMGAHPLLADVDPYHRRALAAHARVEHVPPGRHIVQEGRPASALHLIVRGDISLEVHVPGRGPIRLETLHDGDVLGWTPLVDTPSWRLDARALSDCEMIVLDADGVRAVCDRDPTTGYALYRRLLPVVVERLQHTRMRLIDLFAHPREVTP